MIFDNSMFVINILLKVVNKKINVQIHKVGKTNANWENGFLTKTIEIYGLQ